MSTIAERMSELKETPIMKELFEYFKEDQERILEQTLELVQIPAYSNFEDEKAAHFQKLLEAEGYGTEMDEVCNVLTMIKGTGNGPKLLVTGHLDTVFPPETDLTIRKEGSRYYCPGISDDTRADAEVLSICRAIRDLGIKPVGDLVIGANVGEEGLGNQRGMRCIFGKPNDIDGYISLESSGGLFCYNAAGCYRYKFTFTGPGGHSLGNFGMPNPIHAMSKAIAKIGCIRVPEDIKTSYNVGVVQGGVSVNSIAKECSFLIDIRSYEMEPLNRIRDDVFRFVEEAVKEENEFWHDYDKNAAVSYSYLLQADKPAGRLPDDHPMIQAARASWVLSGQVPDYQEAGTGDNVIPISKGIPAVVMGSGGSSGNGHNINEWFDDTDAHVGLWRNMLLILALIGVDGVCEPILPKIKR